MSSELPKDQTVNAYDKRASFYETKWKAYLDHTHEAFLRNIEVTENDTILDISGGTGLLARMLIRKGYLFKHLVINDPSGRMLDIARHRLSDKSKISFTNCRAEEIRYEANSFDCIFCLNSFHFYTRQQHVLDRCHGILRPGGRLYILDWNRSGFFIMVNKILKWSTSDHIDTRCLTEMSKLLDKSGFEIDSKDGWGWRYWKFFFVEAHKSG